MNNPTKEQVIFCLNWLSNINANKNADTGCKLITNAVADLDEAFKNHTLLEFLGQFTGVPSSETFQPAWGPATAAGRGADEVSFVANATMYMAKGRNVDAATGAYLEDSSLYVVGVAGTNPVSFNGWFGQDMNVTNQKEWKSDSESRGFVSEGSFEGLEMLLNLKEGQCLTEGAHQESADLITSLQNLISQDKNSSIEVAVTGHSLGGGLAPLLALYLKENEKSWANGKTVTVSTYPTAGPTVCDEKLTTYLLKTIGSNNYVALASDKDVVPHAWDPKNMDGLQNIYADLSFSNCAFGTGVKSNGLISGLIEYAQSLPPKNNPYQRYSQDFTDLKDNGVNSTTKSCLNLNMFAAILAKSEQEKLAAIYYRGGSYDNYDVKEFTIYCSGMLQYFYQVGYMHTSAYLKYLYGSNFASVEAALHLVIDLDESSVERIQTDDLLMSNFIHFLGQAANHYAKSAVVA